VVERLYAEHVRERRGRAEEALAAERFDALLCSSGEPFRYFADDMDAPFRSTPHFAHWTPLEGPHHLLLVRPGRRPRLVRVAPEDYWYEQAPLGDPFWAGEFEVEEVRTEEEAWDAARAPGRVAYVGDAPEKARARGFEPEAQNPAGLVARLDWDRSYKTAYEVACVERAEEIAARGHRAARAAFEGGASELEIHQAYVTAAGCVDKDLPYESIVALDEKGATLHYVGKRRERGGRVLLIDSGARHLGYCSDVTRTWTRDGCDALFRELVRGVDELQQQLCALVRPGVPYPDIHGRAHVLVGDLLHAAGILRAGGEEAFALGLTRPFFPHGVGHFLGLQVHDVAGHQRAASGGKEAPPPEHPYLRTTRRIEDRHLFTIEPGLYFIEMLLREHRGGAHDELFDWPLIERLKPCGGIRIEDNVVVTAGGHRNLTRPHV
jgi:Xaa-Pro dipeptidase